MLILQRKNRSKSIPMKRFSLFFITILLLITGCAEPASIEHPLDGDSMERPAYLQIDQEQAKRMMQQDDGHVIVDVRRQDEYDAGHIPGAILIPNESIGTEPPKELPDFNQIILVYCRSGNRSKQAAEKLGQMGYSRVYEFGGIIDWTGEIITKSVEETPADPNDYSGYYENGSYDVVRIEKNGDGYTMSVNLYRLTSLTEGTVSASEEGVVFYTVDAAGNPMTVSFYRDGEKYALRVDQSTWPLLETGTVIGDLERIGDVPPVLPMEEDFERGDLIDPADLPDAPQSHYVFQPKVCSVYMEEIFGKDMCEAWYNLVDAVMAGEDTFACKDQHTYDWVMGQFPERLFPVLTEIIDYAWDRENSVIDGVASFTWLVPPEEAAAKIEEFGSTIEGILNKVLEDDYSDVEKALALYDYFSKTYTYDYETADKMYEVYVDYTSSYRFFETGIGICHEISSAYSYLLMQVGVDATIMMGDDHQWSYVRINGHNYHIDPTFVISDQGSLAYFMMTDEQREATGYSKAGYIICSNYTQDYPHPDYTADDDTFRPIWSHSLEAFFPSEDKILCWQYSEGWEKIYMEFDYSGF